MLSCKWNLGKLEPKLSIFLPKPHITSLKDLIDLEDCICLH